MNNQKQKIQQKRKVRGQQLRRKQTKKQVGRKSRGTCLSPPVLPKVWRRPLWMTLESPSRVSSYEEQRKEGRREQTDEEASVFSGEEEGSPQTSMVEKSQRSVRAVALARRNMGWWLTCWWLWLTVPGMCVLVVLWPLGPVVVVLLIFFFFRSSSRCSFCLFCTSISSEMKLFFTWIYKHF